MQDTRKRKQSKTEIIILAQRISPQKLYCNEIIRANHRVNWWVLELVKKGGVAYKNMIRISLCNMGQGHNVEE